jgi:hypothetical protein
VGGGRVKGRRLDPVYILDNDALWRPGDYCGPVFGYTADLPMVRFRLPNGSFGHVCSPPHTFRECPDGSLEIRNSIGHHYTDPAGVDRYWHGYLDEGHRWRDA